MGSVELERDVRSLGPSIHVFGHSHMRCDATYGPTRFVQSSLGYPAERNFADPSPTGRLKRIWPLEEENKFSFY